MPHYIHFIKYYTDCTSEVLNLGFTDPLLRGSGREFRRSVEWWGEIASLFALTKV